MIHFIWWFLAVSAVDVSVTINARFSLSKNEDEVLALRESQRLIETAKENKFGSNFMVFLQNLEIQLKNLVETAAKVAQSKSSGPVEFTTGKYKVKAMKKLGAKSSKKNAVKSKTMKEFLDMVSKPRGLHFSAPFVIRNATSLFKDWAHVQKQWTASRISGDENLEKNLKIPYRAPGAPHFRFQGNMRYWIPPQQIPFSRYITQCFLGSPAKPKIPGQATEECEKTVSAEQIASPSEIDAFNIFPTFQNLFKDFQQFTSNFMEAGEKNSFEKSMGNFADDFMKKKQLAYKFFTFGPSGSGDKLNQEDYLPFFDVLLHGSRRWLLLQSKEFDRVGEKAKEALEFHQTSAYMFFEEKLPELKEEFDLKEYVEVNQEVGDVMFVPSGWFRVSLSLADSISYTEQFVANAPTVQKYVNRHTWFPSYNQYQISYCFEPKYIVERTGGLGNDQKNKWLQEEFFSVGDETQIAMNTMNMMLTCGRVMASQHPLAQEGLEGTKCTPEVWRDCRQRYLKHVKLIKRASDLDFSWLPTAPTDLVLTSKDEL